MPKTVKPRIHNEYFDQVSLGGRKSCPNCHHKLNGGIIVRWFEYHNVRQYNIQYCCKLCFCEVIRRLRQHADPCGCTFQLNWKGPYNGKPDWLNFDALTQEVTQ